VIIFPEAVVRDGPQWVAQRLSLIGQNRKLARVVGYADSGHCADTRAKSLRTRSTSDTPAQQMSSTVRSIVPDIGRVTDLASTLTR